MLSDRSIKHWSRSRALSFYTLVVFVAFEGRNNRFSPAVIAVISRGRQGQKNANAVLVQLLFVFPERKKIGVRRNAVEQPTSVMYHYPVCLAAKMRTFPCLRKKESDRDGGWDGR